MAEQEIHIQIALIGRDGPFLDALREYLSAPGRKVTLIDGAGAGPLEGPPPAVAVSAEEYGEDPAFPDLCQGLAEDCLAVRVRRPPAIRGFREEEDLHPIRESGTRIATIRLDRGNDAAEDREVVFPAIAALVEREEERRGLLGEIVRLQAELDRRDRAQDEKLEEKTRELGERLEAISRRDEEKAEFLNFIAHKMRTPLTAITGFAEILAHGIAESEEERRGMVRNILQSAIELGDFLNDAVEFLQRSSGSINLTKAEFDLVPHLQRIIRERTKAHGEKRIRVVYRGLNSVKIIGDSRSISSAIERIIDNAFKYSKPEGVVEISLQEEKRPPLLGGTTMVLKIQDHGPGLHRHQIEKIFRPTEIYADGDGAPGHGLGLAIAQEAIRAHGGQITVQSEGPNRGCLVTVELALGRYRASFAMNRIPLGKLPTA